MTHATPRSRSRRRAAALTASAAAVVAFDLLMPGLDGLTLPLYTGAVLAAATAIGANAALLVAVVCAAIYVGVYGPHASDAMVVGAVALLLGASLVGRVLERLRQQVEQLERLVASRPTSGPVVRPTAAAEPAARPGAPASARRASTGNLPHLLYRYARLLNVTDEDAIYAGLALTLEEALPAERVAVHRLTDAGFEQAAGDPLEPPRRSMAEGDEAVFTVDGDGRTAYGRVRAGAAGPVAAVIVAFEPGSGDRRRALRLLGTFVEWASASVGHARALQRVDAETRAASAREAEARGRATARFFAETGALPLIPVREEPPPSDEDDGEPAGGTMHGYATPHTRPSLPAIAGHPPRAVDSIDTDDTLRLEPQAIAESVAAVRKAHITGLPFGPARPEIPRGLASAPATAIEPPDDPPAGGERPGDEVRAAIERMSRRLTDTGSMPGSLDEAPFFADYDLLGHGQIDDAMVAAEDLPLIGGPGLGVATEVGRSPVHDRFAHLLADLSDHLDSEG